MKAYVCLSPKSLGSMAAAHVARLLNDGIARNNRARIVLSTGASQFTTLEALIHADVDWSRVEMFHLDEYVGLPATHPASFRRYLRERFISQVPLARAVLVEGAPAQIPALTAELRSTPIDVGLIGIGENAHIAFNDPPADFDTREAYIQVKLNERCRQQQVGEGWFTTLADVPECAISMTPYQIMQCEHIISCVPYACKAEAVMRALTQPLSPQAPATLLKTHADFSIYVDPDSFALTKPRAILPFEEDDCVLQYMEY